MINKITYVVAVVFITLIPFSCIESEINKDKFGEDKLIANKVPNNVIKALTFYDTVYVPIYSEVYSHSEQTKFSITATLSIRNTSLTDSIFINDIDYYNTKGNLEKKYLDQPISLSPLESFNYIVEKDISDGTGANFIINWGAKTTEVKPMFQGVMISIYTQQAVSFITNGISISK